MSLCGDWQEQPFVTEEELGVGGQAGGRGFQRPSSNRSATKLSKVLGRLDGQGARERVST